MYFIFIYHLHLINSLLCFIRFAYIVYSHCMVYVDCNVYNVPDTWFAFRLVADNCDVDC